MPASPGLAVSVYLSLAVALSPALVLAATVAELRDSQQRSLEGEAQLLLANQGLQQFVHMASHDLREPINAIAQFSSLVEQDHGGVLPAEARQYLAWVRAEALRLRLLLLDDVLQYSEVRRGDLPPPQPVALSEVMLHERAQAVRQVDRRIPGVAAPHLASLCRSGDHPRRGAEGAAVAR